MSSYAQNLSIRDNLYLTEMKKYSKYKRCIYDAAKLYQVDEWILMAVVRHEDGPPHGFLKNPNGTKDYGLTCINDVRFEDLKREGFGHITPQLVMKDPCLAIHTAAYFLKVEEFKENQRSGSTDWLTVAGNYHYNYRGDFPHNHHAYVEKIRNVLKRMERATLNFIAKK
ncbi:lytic transglycosylase domain-containing protein [Vibrio nigripulchritudo]|uniref:lytic transglycosylase domain-containing protein n=1 Tax=Vibrio nigripulchritudo TaxID=28173 RepID=UPI00190C44FA|nr:lytic transglycosylase domain-containing protein [Vibrio nigripulchritudo]